MRLFVFEHFLHHAADFIEGTDSRSQRVIDDADHLMTDRDFLDRSRHADVFDVQIA